MIEELSNSAYIDGSNLHNAMKDLGWALDYKKLRVWLKEKFDISNAYIFLGYKYSNKHIYKYLIESGYNLVFKEILITSEGKIKGNCDAELVLNIVNDYYSWKYWKALIISSDGDFACVANFLNTNNAFLSILSPRDSCSLLLRKLPISIMYLSTQRNNLELNSKNEKALDGDETP